MFQMRWLMAADMSRREEFAQYRSLSMSFTKGHDLLSRGIVRREASDGDLATIGVPTRWQEDMPMTSRMPVM